MSDTQTAACSSQWSLILWLQVPAQCLRPLTCCDRVRRFRDDSVDPVSFLSEAVMRVAQLLIGCVAFTLAAGNDAFACTCPSSGPPCQNAFQVDTVFAGTVRSITPLPDDGPPLPPGEMRIPRTVRVEFDSVVS